MATAPSREKASKSSAYRLGAGEKKLPRPIVFWSDNERDAFRRNKIVQTRYTMVLDDIENQRRTSAKSLKHETHKYRIRSAKYRTENKPRETTSVEEKEASDEKRREKDEHKGELSDEDDGSDNDNESWNENEQKSSGKEKGIITKHKKPSVKFSVYKEFIPNNISKEEQCTDKMVGKNALPMGRSHSAPRSRSIPDLPGTFRSRSVLSEAMAAQQSPRKDACSDRPISSARSSKSSASDTGSDKRTKNRPGSSIFFDRSVAAFELRKELQRLAKLRKTTVATSPYTITDALRDEKEKYFENRQKIEIYLKKIEDIKRESMTINKWTQEDIEQSLNLT